MSPNGRIDSAPKKFEVLALKFERDPKPLSLGVFEYDAENGAPLQMFHVENVPEEVYPMVELDILSNHGNQNYTCLYRFRVHGKP